VFGYILQKLSQHDAWSNIELKSQNSDVQVFNIITKELPALNALEPKYKEFFLVSNPALANVMRINLLMTLLHHCDKGRTIGKMLHPRCISAQCFVFCSSAFTFLINSLVQKLSDVQNF
jgi:hypothetical protein